MAGLLDRSAHWAGGKGCLRAGGRHPRSRRRGAPGARPPDAPREGGAPGGRSGHRAPRQPRGDEHPRGPERRAARGVRGVEGAGDRGVPDAVRQDAAHGVRRRGHGARPRAGESRRTGLRRGGLSAEDPRPDPPRLRRARAGPLGERRVRAVAARARRGRHRQRRCLRARRADPRGGRAGLRGDQPEGPERAGHGPGPDQGEPAGGARDRRERPAVVPRPRAGRRDGPPPQRPEGAPVHGGEGGRDRPHAHRRREDPPALRGAGGDGRRGDAGGARRPPRRPRGGARRVADRDLPDGPGDPRAQGGRRGEARGPRAARAPSF